MHAHAHAHATLFYRLKIADCSAERCQANCPQNCLGRQIIPNLSPGSSLLVAAAPVGLGGVTAGGSVTAVSANTVVVGRAIVVRVVVTTVGVGVYSLAWRNVGRAVDKGSAQKH